MKLIKNMLKTFESFSKYNADDFDSFMKEYKNLILELLNNNDEYLSDLELKELYDDIKNYILKYVKNNGIIYRRINVSDEFINDIKDLDNIKTGIYWTMDKSLIKQWNSSEIYDDRFNKYQGTNPIIFTAKIKSDDINYNETIKNQIISSESEITLNIESQIDVIKINISGEDINLPNILFIT